MTEQEIMDHIKFLGETIGRVTVDGIGFVLVVFPQEDHKIKCDSAVVSSLVDKDVLRRRVENASKVLCSQDVDSQHMNYKTSF